MFQIAFAKGCAWRAAYLRVGPMGKSGFRQNQIAYISIDPTARVWRNKRFHEATLAGAIGRFEFRFGLPNKIAGVKIAWWRLDGRRTWRKS